MGKKNHRLFCWWSSDVALERNGLLVENSLRRLDELKMATAEFVGANLGPMHPMHSVVGQPIIDMGLNGDVVDSRKRPLEGDIEGGVSKRSHTVGMIGNGKLAS